MCPMNAASRPFFKCNQPKKRPVIEFSIKTYGSKVKVGFWTALKTTGKCPTAIKIPDKIIANQ